MTRPLALLAALFLVGAQPPQDPTPDAASVDSSQPTLADSWEAVSHSILRDCRVDLIAVVDFATRVMDDATALPATLEINESGMFGIELVDDEMGLTGRVRTQDVATFHETGGDVYLVTRIARDAVLQRAVRYEIHLRWFDAQSLKLEVAVFSQLTGRENQALIVAETTKFGGYEFAAHVDTTESHLATVYCKDLWHPAQTASKAWEEQPPAPPLIARSRALMQAAQKRFARIQRALHFD